MLCLPNQRNKKFLRLFNHLSPAYTDHNCIQNIRKKLGCLDDDKIIEHPAKRPENLKESTCNGFLSNKNGMINARNFTKKGLQSRYIPEIFLHFFQNSSSHKHP